MAQIDDLNAAVAKVQSDVTNLTTAVAAEKAAVDTIIADLKALQGTAAPDLSGAIAALGQVSTNLEAATSAAQAETQAAQAAAPPAPSA